METVEICLMFWRNMFSPSSQLNKPTKELHGAGSKQSNRIAGISVYVRTKREL
jgi:hypothetical protein